MSSKKVAPKVLFLLKKKSSQGGHSQSLSAGLFHSSKMLSEMLIANGVTSMVSEVEDNGEMDREVLAFGPTHVVIEALWVAPERFAVLTHIHPKIKWIVRIHSEMPTLAGEGIAMEWLSEYVKYKSVHISFNSERTNDEMVDHIAKKSKGVLQHKVIYLPNYHDTSVGTMVHKGYYANGCPCGHMSCSLAKRWHNDGLHVGCFGVINPMKNQLLQAMSAIKLGEFLERKIYFHINTQRVEGRGEHVLKNLRDLFLNSGHELVEHGWMGRDVFISVASRMDIGMQISFSETFNITAADMVMQDVPMVVSNEIPFISRLFRTSTTDSTFVMFSMLVTMFLAKFKVHGLNKFLLRRASRSAKREWMEMLGV